MKEGGEGIEEFLASVRQISDRSSSNTTGTLAKTRQISERSSSIKKRDKKEIPKEKISERNSSIKKRDKKEEPEEKRKMWTSWEEKNFEDAVRLCGRNCKQI